MPVHNGGRYLQRAVSSILDQGEKSLELILIDDRSTDNAIEKLSKDDPRLCIRKSPGAGIVSALNHGIRVASGQFIARMDADDYSYPQRFQIQIAWLIKNRQIDIVAGRVRMTGVQEIGRGYRVYEQWINSLTTPAEISKAMFIESPIPHPTVLMPRSLWWELGDYHDRDWPEDYDLWLRAAQSGLRFGKPREIVLDWQDHPLRSSRHQARYNRKAFSRAKAHYLALQLGQRPVLIWGAGPTGKRLFRGLTRSGADVRGFIDIDPRWIGQYKQNRPVFDPAVISENPDLVLVAVSRRGAREEIESWLQKQGKTAGHDYILCA